MHVNLDLARSRMTKSGRRVLASAEEGARKRTGERTLRRVTERGEDGRLRFVEREPVMLRLGPDEIAEASGGEPAAAITDLFRAYRRTVGIDIDTVLSQYRPTDLARRVVGVGSVGTRCYVQLLEGADGDALILQVKEAGPSVLARYGGIAQTSRIERGISEGGEGSRVVGIQRVLQAVSDPFLGWFRSNGRDYYVRQFKDMKGSIDLDGLPLDAFSDYVEACAIVLGRAHAQSPTAGEVIGYAGRKDTAARAILDWSLAYAELSLADFEAVRVAFADT